MVKHVGASIELPHSNNGGSDAEAQEGCRGCRGCHRHHRRGVCAGAAGSRADVVFSDERGLGQRRQLGRARRRGPHLPKPRPGGRSRGADVARVPEHAGSERRQRARSNRPRAMVQRARRADRAERRGAAQLGEPCGRVHAARRARQPDTGLRLLAEPARHPDGLAAGRQGVSGRRGHDLQQLDEQQRRGRRKGARRSSRLRGLELDARYARL